jgi:Protoglobin.
LILLVKIYIVVQNNFNMEVKYKQNIPGYIYGKPEVPKAPLTKKDFELLLDSVLWTKEDEENRELLGEIIKENMKEILDKIVSYFGSKEYLIYYFKDRQAQTTITEYVNNTVDRLAQWLLDICYKPLDENFINYNYLIGIRHTYEGKGKADNVSTVEHIPARYMVTCLFPITVVLKDFIARKVEDPVLTDRLYNTWFKLQVITTALFLIPYTKEGRW